MNWKKTFFLLVLGSFSAAPALSVIDPIDSNRPFRAGFIKLAPDLDAQKPLASVDYGGWVFHEGHLIGALDQDHLVALSLPFKNQIWKAPIQGGLTTPPAVFGDAVFAADQSGAVFKFSASDGKLIWKNQLDAFVSRPFVKSQNSLLAITAKDTLYHLDEETGQVRWAFDEISPETDMPIRSQTPPLVISSMVYHGTAQGDIIAVALDTGKEVWRVSPHYTTDRFKRLMGDLVFYGGSLIFARHDGVIGSLDTKDPQNTVRLWEDGKQLKGITAAVFRAGQFYVGNSAGQILAYDVKTNQKLWSVHLGTGISYLVPGEQTLYGMTHSGMISAIDLATGLWHWNDELGAALVSPPVYKDRVMYLVTGDKNLYGYRIGE